ncbi:uncharacterized protein METZ01_LOCUS317625 [marine metagenome]|uniref:Uncharacterized protein n=1 Tax=marine metagenome TaxID=408172 RepID=A0A382NYV8_9ZZZZ
MLFITYLTYATPVIKKTIRIILVQIVCYTIFMYTILTFFTNNKGQHFTNTPLHKSSLDMIENKNLPDIPRLRSC